MITWILIDKLVRWRALFVSLFIYGIYRSYLTFKKVELGLPVYLKNL